MKGDSEDLLRDFCNNFCFGVSGYTLQQANGSLDLFV